MTGDNVYKGPSICQHGLVTAGAPSWRMLDNYMYLMSTPGGDSDDGTTLVVENAELYNTSEALMFTGRVAMVGDLIRSAADFNGTVWRTAGATPDAATKLKSLGAVLCANGANAKYILPGHGPGFQVTNAMRTAVSSQCNDITTTEQLKTNMLKVTDCSSNEIVPKLSDATKGIGTPSNAACPNSTDPTPGECTMNCAARPYIDTLINSGGIKLVSQSAFDATGEATSYLVRTPLTTAVMDMGWASSIDQLKDEMIALNVSRSCVDFAVASHSHPDHVGARSKFIYGTTHVDHQTVGKNHKTCEHSLNRAEAGTVKALDQYINLVKTPGDTEDGISMVVKNAVVRTQAGSVAHYTGTVAIPGDLIMFKNQFANGAWDTTGADPNAATKLKSIASLICPNGQNAGFILPGHGGGFNVTDAMRAAVNCSSFPTGVTALTTQNCGNYPGVQSSIAANRGSFCTRATGVGATTTAAPGATTTAPPAAVTTAGSGCTCTDNLSSTLCQHYKTGGYCTKAAYYDTMKHHCEMTCGLCTCSNNNNPSVTTQPPATLCQDTGDVSFCQNYARFCAYYDRVQAMCPKTCNMC